MKSRPYLRTVLSLLLIHAALAVPAVAVASTWLDHVDDALEQARLGPRYILVDLYAEWCGWCQVMEQEVFASAEFGEFAKDLVLLRVDTQDGGEGARLRSEYRVGSLPATLILNADRVKVGAISGFQPTAELIESARKEIRGFENLLAAYDKVLRSDRVELQRRLAEDFHTRMDGIRAARLYEQVLPSLAADSTETAWLHYQTADAYRLGRDFGPARRHLERARALAAGFADEKLVERADLLSYYVARNDGECRQAVAALEHYLQRHPRSDSAREARRFLAELKGGAGIGCRGQDTGPPSPS